MRTSIDFAFKWLKEWRQMPIWMLCSTCHIDLWCIKHIQLKYSAPHESLSGCASTEKWLQEVSGWMLCCVLLPCGTTLKSTSKQNSCGASFPLPLAVIRTV